MFLFVCLFVCFLHIEENARKVCKVGKRYLGHYVTCISCVLSPFVWIACCSGDLTKHCELYFQDRVLAFDLPQMVHAYTRNLMLAGIENNAVQFSSES